tara:strand:- start:3141 stop:3536 length:396 start_codon:yes stop_codon:yes gene_type:complete
MPKTQTERVTELEKLCRKVIRKAFKDSTLDYTVQISASSLEPGKVKYGFMINGLKKEIQPVAMSFYTYDECKKTLEGLLKTVDYVELEKLFHQGRINVYKNAISSHEDRLKHIEENPDEVREENEIKMEEV